jgi:isopenicillin N synthase-like dioxygenase
MGSLLSSVDFADLAILDISKAATPEGRQQLSNELVKAMHDKGFFYVINHGYSQQQVCILA